MSVFSRLADNRDATSLAARMRAKRLDLFLNLLTTVPRPLTILDVGGTAGFWRTVGFSEPAVEIVLLNLEAPVVSMPGFRTLQGDARDLSAFADGSVDVVYSNSVIEHVGGPADQQQMAREIRRVAKRYFVQTPNHRFPVEPHFVFPAFHYLPLSIRAFLLTKFRLGWFEREPDWQRAMTAVESIRLLTKQEFTAFFPGSHLYEERLLGLTKSLVVYEGW